MNGSVVDRGPLGDEVLHEAAVVVGVEVEAVSDRVGDVDAVHPDVTGEADVEEVRERLLADDRQLQQPPGWRSAGAASCVP